MQQPLLAGFGLGPNLRYLRIARNNKRISDIAFREQVSATVTQIQNMYWNLVNAYEQARVSEQSLQFAQRSLDNAQKQLQLEAVPAMDVLRAEAEVSRCDQELTVARTNLELQESLMKNALTRNLDDPTLEAMPVLPADQISSSEFSAPAPLADLLAAALQNRPDLAESDIDLQSRQISRKAARNALLPSLSLTASYSGSGIAGELNPIYQGTDLPAVPTSLSGALMNTFNNSNPDYYVGLNLQVPLRNRVAKADQYRSELEYRQAELRREQLKKQIRIEVRNARYALEQSRARVDSARKARDLASRTFAIAQKELELGAGSHLQVLTAQRDLALAEQRLAEAVTTCEKARVELTRATGTTLEQNQISIEDAISGTIGSSRIDR
jgi:outer membrane protein TolC